MPQDTAPTSPPPAFGLDDLTCDAGTGALSSPTDAVHIGARGARILALLMLRRGQIVTQADLITAGWVGFQVDDSSLAVEIASLRGALHRLLGGMTWITAIPHQGYRLSLTGTVPALKMPGQWQIPTIGVLPIAATAPAMTVTAAELTQTVTATLALHSGLSIAPADVAMLVDAPDGTALANLDLRYLLQGTAEGDTAPWRVTLSLHDTKERDILWSQTFEDALPLTRDRQERLAAEVVQALDVLLVRGEEAVIGYPPTRNLRAWSHYICGLGHAYWPRHDALWGHEVLLALQEWQKALALDPDNAALLATVGAGHAVLAAYPTVISPGQSAAEAHRHLQAALDREPDHPVALAFYAMMLSELDRFEVAVEVARRAIRLAPHAPAVTAVASVALCAAGLADEAVEAVERAMAATPHFPSIFSPPLARAWRSAGRVAEAIRFLEALNEEPHKFDGRELILAYMQAGRHEDAVNVATQLLLLEPGFTVSGWLATQHRVDAAAIARDAAALRAVGLPE
jgi:tetratricopeptide (TPR) repeat protein